MVPLKRKSVMCEPRGAPLHNDRVDELFYLTYFPPLELVVIAIGGFYTLRVLFVQVRPPNHTPHPVTPP